MEYYKAKGERLVCQLCAHLCQLKEAQVGLCGVNKNTGSRIENLVYGHLAALHVDPIEKKPLYHFLPGSKSLSLGTVGCNFHCAFCQNWGISQEHRIDTSRYISPQEIVSMAQSQQCESIAYTYNEPTIFYPYARDIAKLAHAEGIKSVFVTNGFESPAMIDDMQGVIDAVNVDLKSFDASYYKKGLGGRLETVLENLRHFKRNGIWVEVTTLIVSQRNDSDEELFKIAHFIAQSLGCETPWHVSAFHPDYKERELPDTPRERLDRAYGLGRAQGLHYVYRGNIAANNTTYCKSCGTALIRRTGFGVEALALSGTRCAACNTPLEGVFHE